MTESAFYKDLEEALLELIKGCLGEEEFIKFMVEYRKGSYTSSKRGSDGC